MKAVLNRLKKAIDSDTHQHDGWHAYELCHGLANLAADPENLKNAVSRERTWSSLVLMLYKYCVDQICGKIS